MPKLFFNEKGLAPPLIILSALAFLVFLLITNTFEFQDKLFSVLYPKPTPFASEKSQSAPDRILVKFRSEVSEDVKEKIKKDKGLEKKDEIKQIGVEILKVPPQAKDKVLEALKKSDKVEYAEEDFERRLEDTPNDPAFAIAHWNLKKINSEAAWDITKGDPSVAVAVLDSGVLETHEDLVGKFTADRYNFVDGNTDVTDVTGHGTAVMGLVGAITNNAKGVASLGRNVSIMPLRVVKTDGYADSSKIADAIIYAANNGAKVINISLGGLGESQTEQDAINYAWGKGVVLAAAAGSSGTEGIVYPAKSDNVIAVGGTDANDLKANFSNTGQGLDVVAPGVNVYTTTRLGAYSGFSGTSSSTPHVSALAGLIFSLNPNMANQELVDIITSTALDLGATGWDDQFGFGRINALAALQGAGAQVVEPAGSPSPNPTPTPSPSPTPAPTPVGNRLKNPSFELDTNNDGRPDSWSNNSKFTRNSTTVHNGIYAGRFFATDNTGATITQVVSNLSAGTTYTTECWVNIPATADSFTFKIQIRWRTAANTVISTQTVKTYGDDTIGAWSQATMNLLSPSGTANAQVRLVATSLNGTIYIDDCVLQ